jgi:hypothetical protein
MHRKECAYCGETFDGINKALRRPIELDERGLCLECRKLFNGNGVVSFEGDMRRYQTMIRDYFRHSSPAVTLSARDVGLDVYTIGTNSGLKK